jgi:FG-GAP repeat protein
MIQPKMAWQLLGVLLVGLGAAMGTAWAQAPVSFVSRSDYGVGISPSSVAAGDFNGDGVLDLAVANSGSASVSVLLGLGDGTFS